MSVLQKILDKIIQGKANQILRQIKSDPDLQRCIKNVEESVARLDAAIKKRDED